MRLVQNSEGRLWKEKTRLVNIVVAVVVVVGDYGRRRCDWSKIVKGDYGRRRYDWSICGGGGGDY